jgi:LCP family protein required for cell wall assembly
MRILTRVRTNLAAVTGGSGARRRLVALLVFAQVAVLGSAAFAAVDRWLSMPLDDDGMYALLVLGSDEGPPTRLGSPARNGRADAIHLVVVDQAREHVSIISFPRDSYVPVRGMGTTKINAMLTRGPENAVGTVEDLTGIDIDDYVLTGFGAMTAGVDEFGGVDVDVEQRLYDPSGSSSDLQPGPQTLVGWQTLAYSRDRHSRSNGDIGRSTAQATVLRAMHQKLLAEDPSPGRLVDYVSIFRRHTETSIRTDRLFRLAVLALTIDPANIAQVTLPGNIGTAGSASVYRLSDGAFGIFADIREDGVLASLQGEG